MLRRALPLQAGAALAALASPAMAHSPEAGLPGFQVGFLHPLSTAPQLLALLAVGLFCGSALPGRRHVFAAALFALLFPWGLWAGQTLLGFEEQDLALLGLAVFAAALAALAPGEGGPVAVAAWLAAGLGGLLVGMASRPDPGPAAAFAVTCAGSFVAAGLAVLYVGAGASSLRLGRGPDWTRIGLRVAAAWVAAVSALLLALGAAAPA